MEKRQILVLDAYTNGHQAAFRFIRKMGWKRKDCQLIFCRTHKAMLEKLSRGSFYAVLPVHNTVCKDIVENVEGLSALRKRGFKVREVSRFRLHINHCLVAAPHIRRKEELERVLSHPAALTQCAGVLNKLGLSVAKRSKCDSTAGAAKKVSLLPTHVKFGALATREAAAAYGLRILEEKFQDVKKNWTTFLLLQNEVEVESVTVGIVGINGRFGQRLKSFFANLGCTVIGSDVGTRFDNNDIVIKADVVIFAVPIKDTPKIIANVAPFSRTDQLFLDITSVKMPAMKAMLQSKAQVVGLHPMFAPSVPFEGQTIVACPARFEHPRWKTWLQNVLTKTGSRIKWSNAQEHDQNMTVVQGVPHFANVVNAILVMEMGVNAGESLTFTSPFYRVMFSLMGRLLSQKSGLYASILMENSQVPAIIRKRIAIERKLLGIIQRKDRAGFKDLIRQTRAHFGTKVVAGADDLFRRLIAVMTTLYNPDSLILEFDKKDDNPGLLLKIAAAFERFNVNLCGISFVDLGEKRQQFTLSLRESRQSANVQKALELIEKWETPKIKVIVN